MDAHYYKVMKMIDEVTQTGTRLYFAYSASLDRSQFDIWRDQHSYNFFDLPAGKVAKAKSTSLIFDFPSRWWGGRVAGLVDKEGSEVYGVLFEIENKNWPVIQHKEGVITGMSVERQIILEVDGKELVATAFTTNPERALTSGAVSMRYLDALVKGASDSGLPSAYIEAIKLNAV